MASATLLPWRPTSRRAGDRGHAAFECDNGDLHGRDRTFRTSRLLLVHRSFGSRGWWRTARRAASVRSPDLAVGAEPPPLPIAFHVPCADSPDHDLPKPEVGDRCRATRKSAKA